jgi:thymidylate synthase (FAD)
MPKGLTVFALPKVSLLKKEIFINPLEGEWDTDAPSGGEALAEFAGRLCYLSFGEDVSLGEQHKSVKGRQGNGIYLENIKKQRHGSVIEHATFSILVEQVSRSFSHEIVRHRAGFSYSQLSQRYVDESQVAFVLPPDIKLDSDAYKNWYQAQRVVLEAYRALLGNMMEQMKHEAGSETEKKKRARQTARSVLTNAVETKIVVSGNGRSFRNMLALRGNRGAEREIRRFAVLLAQLLKKESPNIFADVEVFTDEDGYESLRFEYTGV